MAVAYISIGSNVDAKTNIRAALAALEARYGKLNLSTIYQNSAVGFDGDDFLNLVVAVDTEQSIPEFVESLHKIEATQGRIRNTAKFSSRTLDMDLLLYDSEVFHSASISIPRDEITRYAFVLQPLFELIPDYTHPSLNKTIAELWAAFDKTDINMQVVKSL